MHHYDIYRDQLSITHPSFGHALRDPAPGVFGPVKVGDVGYVREGRFICLFNALLPADDPSHKETPLPKYHEPLTPNNPDHITKETLKPNRLCSAGVKTVPVGPESLTSGPREVDEVLFSCRGKCGGAVLSLPMVTQRQNTRARGDFGKWMLNHIDRWFAFARGLGLGINQMEEMILVTGCDHTGSWANVTFLEGQTYGQASLGVKVVQGSDVGINWQFSAGSPEGVVCNRGPEGKNLPEDQCIFIRGFRAVRTINISSKLKAAGPNPSLEDAHDGNGPDKELISTPASTKYRDPLRVLVDYIVERSPECHMILVHDDDLAHVAGSSDRNEMVQPGALMTYVKTCRPEITQIPWDPLTTDEGSQKPRTEAPTVAMFSVELHKWDGPMSQAFTTASPSKYISGDFSTAVRERCQQLGYMLATSLADIISYASKAMNPGRRTGKYPIFITLAILVCACALAVMPDAVGSALAPMCTVPAISLLCPAIAHGGPSRPPNPERIPLWADFPSLLKVESKTLETLLDGTIEVPGLALEMKKAEMATSDLAMLVHISKLNSREFLADALREFVKDARKVSRGLMSFSSSVGSAVDNIIAVNDYALHRIEVTNSQPSGLSIRCLWSSCPSATSQVVTRTFIEAMNTLSADMQSLVSEAEMSISDLNKLEKHLKSLHEVVSREHSSISSASHELLAQLYMISIGNHQPKAMNDHIALLRAAGGYWDRALAHVVSAWQVLQNMAEDMEGLRERVAIPQLVGDAIPIGMHIQSLRDGLERLKRRRRDAKQSEEELVNRILGSVDGVEVDDGFTITHAQ